MCLDSFHGIGLWSSIGRRCSRVLVALCSLLVVVSGARAASAQESDACRKIRAQADSRAALLFYPTVHVQGVRLPTEGDESGSGLLDGDRWQARAMVSVSPLDIVRGVKTLSVAEAACGRKLAEEQLLRALEVGLDLGRETALRRQIAHLDRALPRMQTIVTQAENRLAQGAATFLEVNQLRLEVMRTQRKIATLRAELERLRERDLPTDVAPLAPLVAAYETRSMDVERRTSGLRRLQPWQVSLRGGVIPDRNVDYFGILEVSYNLGDIAQRSAERRYLEARSAELASTRTELRQRAALLRRQLASSVQQLEHEKKTIVSQLDMLRRQRRMLDQLDAPDEPQTLALLDVQLIPLESELVYVDALISARSAYRENA